MKIIKKYGHYRIRYDKYMIILEINYELNCYNVFNEKQEKEFIFGGIKSNRHKTVLKMIYKAVEFAEKKLQEYRNDTSRVSK